MHLSSTIQTAAVLMALGGIGAYRVQAATQQPQPIRISKAGTQPTYFVEHPDNIQPGLQIQARLASLRNPYSGDAAHIAEGGKLFIAYNCMDCHGAEGSGAMGPSLQDGRMHFGGTPGDIFESIYEGRPDGMPSWGGRISDDQIWQLVAYVETLSKGHNVATENFTGKTLDRGGR